MKIKLLKRLREKFRIVEETKYINTKSGKRITETMYCAEYKDSDGDWIQSGTYHPTIEQPLCSVHFWMRRDLRDLTNKHKTVWP